MPYGKWSHGLMDHHKRLLRSSCRASSPAGVALIAKARRKTQENPNGKIDRIRGKESKPRICCVNSPEPPSPPDTRGDSHPTQTARLIGIRTGVRLKTPSLASLARGKRCAERTLFLNTLSCRFATPVFINGGAVLLHYPPKIFFWYLGGTYVLFIYIY